VVSDYAGEAFSLVDFGYDFTDVPDASDLATVVQREILLHFPLLVPAINHRLGHALVPVLRYLTTNPHAQLLTERTLSHVDECLEDDVPFFATVFYSGPHIPYAAEFPGYRRFARRDYRGPNRYGFSVRDIRDIAAAEDRLAQDEVEQVRALYDGAASVADDALARLLEGLEERGVLENTLVIVTADHGEHLFEHGNAVDHGKWFRGGDAASRVPLVLAGPGVPADGTSHSFLVRSLDIAPTILRLATRQDPPPTMQGIDLSKAFADPSFRPALIAFAETGLWLSAPTLFAAEKDALVYPSITELLAADPEDQSLVLQPRFADLAVTAKHRMLRTQRYKLVYEPTLDGARYRLFDVATDPGNTHDLSAEKPDVLAALKLELHRWMSSDPARTFDARDHLVREFTYSE
jgi:arylsulfatase A-like enzyme